MAVVADYCRSMRRTGLGYAALAVSITVVFAPRPTGSDPTPVDVHSESLFSRVLAPTIDRMDVRERNVARTVVQAAPLWLSLLVAIVALPRLLALFSLEPSRSVRLRARTTLSHGCRAPPAASL